MSSHPFPAVAEKAKAQPVKIRKIAQKFLATDIDDELILVHADTGVFFSAKETGRAIWQAIDRNEAIEDIVQGLQREYDVAPEDCLRSVLAFADQLVEAGLAEYR